MSNAWNLWRERPRRCPMSRSASGLPLPGRDLAGNARITLPDYSPDVVKVDWGVRAFTGPALLPFVVWLPGPGCGSETSLQAGTGGERVGRR